MGLRIVCINEDAEPPKPVALELTCDALMHDPGNPSGQHFFDPQGFVPEHRMAMEAGWLERQDSLRGRIFLCPCCSGKRKGEPAPRLL